MADISVPALEKANAKLRQLVPSAHRVEVQVILTGAYSRTPLNIPRSAMSPKKPMSKLWSTISTPGAA